MRPAASEASGNGRAGTPATLAPGGTSRVTTLPAPITASLPIVTPSKIRAPAPTQTLSSMTIPNFVTPDSTRGRAVAMGNVIRRNDRYRSCDAHAGPDRHISNAVDDRKRIDAHEVADPDRAPIAQDHRIGMNLAAPTNLDRGATLGAHRCPHGHPRGR